MAKRKTNEELFREQWRWHDQPGNKDKNKGEWPGFKRRKNPANYSYCFACKECLKNCEECPVNWGVGDVGSACLEDGTLYDQWKRGKCVAGEISRLPWKKGGWYK